MPRQPGEFRLRNENSEDQPGGDVRVDAGVVASIPYRIWPAHPYFADLLIALILCVVLQVVWSDSKAEPKKQDR